MEYVTVVWYDNVVERSTDVVGVYTTAKKADEGEAKDMEYRKTNKMFYRRGLFTLNKTVDPNRCSDY